MKSTVEILREARALIEDEARWTTGSLCDETGRSCALGAIARAAFDASARDAHERETHFYMLMGDGTDAPHPAVMAAARAVGMVEGDDPFRVVYRENDKGHHAKVLALFDRAIAVEEAREQEFTVTSEPVAVPA